MTLKQEEQLRMLCQRDVLFQQLLADCRRREPAYERILDGLPERDRELLEGYVTACEELEHRRTCLAIYVSEK